MIIVGAGMSGLLAANMFRKNNPIVVEAQASLPNNHESLLRFRSEAVSNASGIPFNKVLVRKQINYHGNLLEKPTIPIANEYCFKVTGEYGNRSIWNLDPSYRFIAPPNFISQLAEGCQINYNLKISKSDIIYQGCPVISTMPMYNLMKILDWENIPEFNYQSIWSVTSEIDDPNIDLYQTTYYPNQKLPFYRMSITGNKIIMEFITKPDESYKWNGSSLNLSEYLIHFLEHDFGIKPKSPSEPKIKFQKYGKLIPIDDKLRKEFISWATHEYGIYSLGRWGTHRQLLMDDVVKDINVINNLITSNNYSR